MMDVRFQGTIRSDIGLKTATSSNYYMAGAPQLRAAIQKSTKIAQANFERVVGRDIETREICDSRHTATIVTADGRTRQFVQTVKDGHFSSIEMREAKFIRKVAAFVESVERGEREPGVGGMVRSAASTIASGFSAVKQGLGSAMARIKSGLGKANNDSTKV